MKVPLEWLSEFVVIDIEPEDLARRLTMRGLEVEGLEVLRPGFTGVVAGVITKIDAHPNADNLHICMIDTGSEELAVVCGAPNIAVNDRVPLAKVGAVLGNFNIEKRKLRGIESFGMLCSEKELGLSDDHSGIFILPDDVTPGSEIAGLSLARDVVFDINVPPNRGDCLSVFGIAREVASILNQKAKLPGFKLEAGGKDNVRDEIALEIHDTAACPRYVLKLIKGISIGPSPFWMRRRITRSGMRPINNIVDVTNYVMLELGQPLHAFDLDRLTDARIEVKVAEGPSVFRTLDSIDRGLEKGDILICDGSGPVAIAGIMGGENSEITDTTRDMALESAYFNPFSIRATARRLGIKSEASLRFEKGIDIDNSGYAAERAIHLMQQVAGGTPVKGEREIFEKKETKTIYISYSNINGLLGTHIGQHEITRALRSIDLHIMKEDENGLVISVPNFRHDIDEAADVIEEISRVHGFEHIPDTSPVSVLKPQISERKGRFLDMAKEYFKATGFYEIINFSFFSTKDVENFLIPQSDDRTKCVPIMNPISRDWGVMRTFMTPAVLKCMAYNLNRGAKNLRFFEKGKVFFQENADRIREETILCFAMTGREKEYFWREKYPEYDLFDIKGVIEGLMEALGADCTVVECTEPFLDPARSANIAIDGVNAGWVGAIRDDILRVYEIEQSIYCAELQFDIILKKGNLALQYRPIPRYPQMIRDFSFHADDRIPISMLVDKIKGISPLIVSVGIFDMFRKETRSVSIRVVFQSYEDTLTDERVNALQEQIIGELTNIDGISLRA
ncbi:MAG TPA: phenylalanine--tRNA ligase subunit beta [Syntrophorhabdaceae bacterium]|nr:phenylalanine--tRNA ligase subunit beta [Syntrophorhabdaceae bacterium]